MGLRAILERFLSGETTRSEPASSAFGATADRVRADQAKADEYDFEVAKEKGRPRGF